LKDHVILILGENSKFYFWHSIESAIKIGSLWWPKPSGHFNSHLAFSGSEHTSVAGLKLSPGAHDISERFFKKNLT
jgi:hypothetical protein